METILVEHHWIVSVTYEIESAQAEELVTQRRLVLPEDYAVLGPICFVCETPYEEAFASCPGEPADVADTNA